MAAVRSTSETRQDATFISEVAQDELAEFRYDAATLNAKSRAYTEDQIANFSPSFDAFT